MRRANGVVACRGQNASGELGFYPSDAGQETLPVDVPALGSPSALAAGGGGYGCELLQGGVAKCWGANGNGVLGLPASDAGAYPPTTLMTGTTAVCAGSYGSCTIDAIGGSVRCWSGMSASDGQPFPEFSNAVQLACGSDIGCARIADGTVWLGLGVERRPRVRPLLRRGRRR